MCAKPRRSLYGTRAEPARWEALCTSTLESVWLVGGKASACCFYHAALDVRCVVHDSRVGMVEKLTEEKFLGE
eukprot:12476704-Alexandrium_andersonii.AAC.1